jgi:hypothetical protein
MIIRSLCDEAERFCREFYREHDELDPMFLCAETTGKRFVVMVPKLEGLEGLRQVFREKQVIAYCLITECWASGSAAEKHDRPCNQPDRQEVLTIVASDGTAACIG